MNLGQPRGIRIVNHDKLLPRYLLKDFLRVFPNPLGGEIHRCFHHTLSDGPGESGPDRPFPLEMIHQLFYGAGQSQRRGGLRCRQVDRIPLQNPRREVH